MAGLTGDVALLDCWSMQHATPAGGRLSPAAVTEFDLVLATTENVELRIRLFRDDHLARNRQQGTIAF